MRHARLHLSALCLVPLLASPSWADEASAWRLFVANHAEPVVRVVDLADGAAGNGSVSANLPVAGHASLHRSASGRLVFAAQGDAGVVTAIDTGIVLDDHGDHGDIKVQAPKLAGVEVKGADPSHVVEHGGEFAIFFDGDGLARILSEKAVLEGRADTVDVKAPAPHHGAAVAWGRHVLLSEPHPEKPDELPVGIQVVMRDGVKVGGLHACPDLHGEASSGNMLAFACATGLLLVKNDPSGPDIMHLPYDADLPEGKTTTLLGGKGLQYFLGNYGADKLVLIDPAAEDKFRLVELPTRRVHFAVDSVRPRFAYVITEDGQLHRLDVLTGAIERSLELTEPYSMNGHWRDPRPRIAVAGDVIAVTDPLKSTIRLVNAESFEPRGEIAVEGKPYSIVAVGGSGETH